MIKLIAVAAMLMFSSLSHAADLSVCVNAKGKLVAKSKCARGETALSNKSLGGSGDFNPSKCQMREVQSSAANTVNVSAFCLTTEFAVSGGCDSNNSQSYARLASLRKGTSGMYIENAYSGFKCAMSTFDNSVQTVTAQVWCCKP